MTDLELQQLVESNAKSIQALGERQAEDHQQQLEHLRRTDRQIAELTRNVATFVRDSSEQSSALMTDRATMYELVTQVAEGQAAMSESLGVIANALSRLAEQREV